MLKKCWYYNNDNKNDNNDDEGVNNINDGNDNVIQYIMMMLMFCFFKCSKKIIPWTFKRSIFIRLGNIVFLISIKVKKK